MASLITLGHPGSTKDSYWDTTQVTGMTRCSPHPNRIAFAFCRSREQLISLGHSREWSLVRPRSPISLPRID
jgi:hypothetical protein